MGPLKPSAVKAASEAILHYRRKLVRALEEEDGGQAEVVLHCLTKLERIPVNIAILQVRQLRQLRLATCKTVKTCKTVNTINNMSSKTRERIRTN